MFSKQEKVFQEDHGKSIKPDYETADTVVGASVIVEGDFASQGNIVVKGIVSGSVRTTEHLIVEKGAKIMAHVRAGSAVIAGEVRGNIKIKNSLELTETARVLGDVESGIIVVAGGAGLSGKCHTAAVDMSALRGDLKKDDKKVLAGKKKYGHAGEMEVAGEPSHAGI